MIEIIINLVVGFTITVCTIIYLFLSKVITWQQLKDIFTPDEEICGIKLYRLNNTLHVLDYKFFFIYTLPVLAITMAILLELSCLIFVCCFGLIDPLVMIYYNIFLGGIEVANFLSLLCISDRKRWIEAKLLEPSFNELCTMTNSELQQMFIKYPRIFKNTNYMLFILNSRPTFNINRAEYDVIIHEDNFKDIDHRDDKEKD